MKTTITLPNGIRIIIADKSDKYLVAMFNEAFNRLNSGR